jgi:predicted DNA-binding transcriptional regulator YafY
MRADRLLSILLLLQSRGKMTTQVLADSLEVSRRTILRDVDALSYAGVPIYAEGGHGGGITLDEKYRTTLTGLNEIEIRALFINENNQFLKDIGLSEAALSTRRKLSAALPLGQQPIAEQVRQRIYIDPTWWWQADQAMPFWGELQRAVFEDRRIQAMYENYQGEVAERVLEPYSLVAKASHWYLIAKRRQEYRLYRVTRFRSVHVLDDHFAREENYDLESFWDMHVQDFRNAVTEYSFTLKVIADQMDFIRQIVPGHFKILEINEQNGWLILHFELETMELAKMLVFGLGPPSEVIDPPELREAVIKRAQEFLYKEWD